MTIRLLQSLAPLAGQMGIAPPYQGIFMALFGIFVSFNPSAAISKLS